MTLPISSTRITVLRQVFVPNSLNDTYDPEPAYTTVATGIKAHISALTGREEVGGGSQVVTQFRLDCNPTDLHNTDRVLDERTGQMYEVEWFMQRPIIPHTQAQLKQVTGIAAGAS